MVRKRRRKQVSGSVIRLWIKKHLRNRGMIINRKGEILTYADLSGLRFNGRAFDIARKLAKPDTNGINWSAETIPDMNVYPVQDTEEERISYWIEVFNNYGGFVSEQFTLHRWKNTRMIFAGILKCRGALRPDKEYDKLVEEFLTAFDNTINFKWRIP